MSKTKQNKSLVEKAIARNGNLRQFKGKKFGRVLSARKVRLLEIEGTYPGGVKAWAEKLLKEAFVEAFAQVLDDIGEMAKKRKEESLLEEAEKRQKVIAANKAWKRKNQPKTVTNKGELKTFAALADVFGNNS